MMQWTYLLWIMRDKDQDACSRLDDCKAAAPYCHARLSSIELSGPSGGPVSVQDQPKTRYIGPQRRRARYIETCASEAVAVQEAC